MTRRLVFTLLLFVSACGFGFGPHDVCQAGATRCYVYGSFVETQTCANHCSDFGCPYQWLTDDVCSPSRQCLMVSGTGAICVLSTAPDPRCTGATGFCDGNVRFACRAGYAVERTACNTVVLPRCISVGDGDAACVPSAASPDANCPAGRSRYCSAAEDLIECVGGESVFRSKCRACTAGATASCAGFLGDTCTGDTQCASGLVCHADALGRNICTAPCSVTATGDDCLQSLGTGGLPYSTYAEIKPPGSRLLCAAGIAGGMLARGRVAREFRVGHI